MDFIFSYQKFTRMKDTSNYSEKDKAAVLGVGLGRAKQDSDEDSSVQSIFYAYYNVYLGLKI